MSLRIINHHSSRSPRIPQGNSNMLFVQKSLFYWIFYCIYIKICSKITFFLYIYQTINWKSFMWIVTIHRAIHIFILVKYSILTCVRLRTSVQIRVFRVKTIRNLRSLMSLRIIRNLRSLMSLRIINYVINVNNLGIYIVYIEYIIYLCNWIKAYPLHHGYWERNES